MTTVHSPIKYCAVIVSGLTDEPNPRLGGRTPLQAARTPHLDAMAGGGRLGQVVSCPPRFEPGSDVGTMTLLGYDPASYYTGRAPLEATAAGIALGPTDTVFRCNLVTCSDNRMADPTGGRITDREARVLIEDLNAELAGDGVEFVLGRRYRALLVARDICGNGVSTTPPHQIPGRPIGDYLPRGRGADRLIELIKASRRLLDAHEINETRRDLGENPANMIWLWGQGRPPQLPAFADRYRVDGAAISTVDTVRGLAMSIGWPLRDLPAPAEPAPIDSGAVHMGLTAGNGGKTDGDYAAIADAALDELADRDLVVVHVSGPDGSSHAGNIQRKLKTIEAIDRDLVGPLRETLAGLPRHRLAVLPDHGTSLLSRAHLRDPVPFVATGEGLRPAGAPEFSESAASKSRCRVKRGVQWMGKFLGGSF